MLHFAPEPFFRNMFGNLFGDYETADMGRSDVDHQVDLQALPMPSGTYDVVYASHVLEHVPNDRAAIAEIRRILKAGGFAVLPVPVVSDVTVEYAQPNPLESMHVRAPGPDYFDRYREFFDQVEIVNSNAFDERYRTYALERRREGQVRLPDYVPICRA